MSEGKPVWYIGTNPRKGKGETMNAPESALAVVSKHEESMVASFRAATNAASMCKAIVVKTAIAIAGRKYIRVEGWQAIAVAHGCIASSRDVERVEGGLRCIGEVRRMSDQAVLASAEGFVGDDEETWGKRAEYAKRAMAQTRAISRACRSAFAHVVVMMDAGLETTPAEEVPEGGFDASKVQGTTTPAPSPTQSAESGNSKPQYDKGAAPISDAQGKRLYAICKQNNVEMDVLKGFLKVNYDIEHSTQIQRGKQYEDICEWAAAGGSLPAK